MESSTIARNTLKALIPAAGFGTRLAPVTRGIPKEMFPLNRKAVIEYVIEEAIAAGIVTIGVVIRKGKEIIRHYLLDVFAGRNTEIHFIDQEKPLGLGDAILASKDFVGGDCFVVMLPDIIFRTAENPTRELVKFFALRGKSCFCLVQVPKQTLHRYGSLCVVKAEERAYKITYASKEYDIMKMPSGDPGLRGCGRTILTPRIFNYPDVERKSELGDGELITWLIRVDEVWGLHVPYRPYDTGSYDGYVEAINAFQRAKAELKNNQEDCSWR